MCVCVCVCVLLDCSCLYLTGNCTWLHLAVGRNLNRRYLPKELEFNNSQRLKIIIFSSINWHNIIHHTIKNMMQKFDVGY